jgi:hypothetical protein
MANGAGKSGALDAITAGYRRIDPDKTHRRFGADGEGNGSNGQP